VPIDDEFHPEAVEVLRRRAKTELRKRLRGVRKNLPNVSVEEHSLAIIEVLEAQDAMRTAKRVALFHPILARKEIDLRPLDARLRARGVEVSYPYIDPDTKVMSFRRTESMLELEEQGFGYAEPSATTPEAESLDVIVVPALALDPRGHRLGYGAGYYDRTIVRYAPPARTLGIVFHFQLLVEVPNTATDVPVDVVISERGIQGGNAP